MSSRTLSALRQVPRYLGLPSLAMALALLVGAAAGLGRANAETPHLVPPPQLDVPAGARTSDVAVLAGGCFWGVQGVFQHVDGVTDVVSGYAGGESATAHYRMVSSNSTGHAESVRITYDPRKISYGHLLRIFFSIAHDPTELNQQGPDVGSQYRSAIFPMDADQARVAQAYIVQLDSAHAFPAPIVTRIEPGKTFYPAEGYHQNFLTLNPTNPYIAINDLPKVEALRTLMPQVYRPDPVLVTAANMTN